MRRVDDLPMNDDQLSSEDSDNAAHLVVCLCLVGVVAKETHTDNWMKEEEMRWSWWWEGGKLMTTRCRTVFI